MDRLQSVLEGLLIGPTWIRHRCEDPMVISAGSTPRVRCDRVTLSEGARQVEPTSETGASRK